MKMRTIPAVALFTLAMCGCASHRDLAIDASEPAVVMDRGGRIVCASTPCVMHVSRETCRLYDSSSGYVILEAKIRGGATLRSMPMAACEVSDGMRLSFRFPSGGGSGCGVILYRGEREEFSITCKDALVR